MGVEATSDLDEVFLFQLGWREQFCAEREQRSEGYMYYSWSVLRRMA